MGKGFPDREMDSRLVLSFFFFFIYLFIYLFLFSFRSCKCFPPFPRVEEARKEQKSICLPRCNERDCHLFSVYRVEKGKEGRGMQNEIENNLIAK